MSKPRDLKCMGGPHDGETVVYQGRHLRLCGREPLPRTAADFAVPTLAKPVMESYRHQEFGHGRLRLHEERYVHSSLTDAQALERMCAAWGVPK